MLTLRDDKDPFRIFNHHEDCDGELWNDDDTLVELETLAERNCEACLLAWVTIDRIIEETDDADYYYAALQALSDYDYLERFKYVLSPSEIEAAICINASIVQRWLNMHEKQVALQRAAEATKPAR